MPKNAYIHVPFCKSKCKYCSFVSSTGLEKEDEYINVLQKNILSEYEGERLNTIYFGGGTPSVLKLKSVETILKSFNYSADCEITFEVNPDDVSSDYLKELRILGINRLSIGAQTFNDDILRLIGRRHNSEQIINAVKIAKSAGFDNISLDLIYGLPKQTLDSLQNDLEIICSLDIRHISTYGLKIEEPSYFFKNKPKNLPDGDIQADMYIFINKFLEQHNFNRYEISNFALKDYESVHNLNYWNNSEYYGFGLAAHGYKDGIRYSNINDLKQYLKYPLSYEYQHKLSLQEQLEEEIFLGLRKSDGIDIKKINNKFAIDFEKKYQKIIDKFSPKYLIKTKAGYRLTLQGVLLSNNILSEFIDV